MNTYDQFERERLRLQIETNKFLEDIMFGYNPQEWSNAINKNYEQYQQEQKPMTREEAIETCAKYAMQYPRVFVDCLAALGLLKFEEVPKKQIEWKHALGNVCWFSEGYDPNKSDSGWRRVDEKDCRDIWVGTHLVLAYQAVEGLKSLGYKIVGTSRDDKISRLIGACRRFVKSRNTMDEASAIKCIETYTKELD